MDEKAVKNIVKDEINKFVKDSLDKEIKNQLHKSNSQSRDELIGTIKNALESLTKTLWVKKDFWRNDIK